ncbi:NAD(P)/FAD-dependent oxidoreductase [Oceaniglobus roseus]|uniref:NAD(P)/FAD-dependent oxidoreductase n=1 Tax=Oceaniglobus roseus TaxID=1737570 RepID=UPI000C7EB96C|nr:NAD(P)-binding protein [Kandeliimicrobium roseum]
MEIAVIGAGLAGLVAARRLADAGQEVTVFDKSRGLGGRLASRRREGWAFDHGAPGVDPAGSGLSAWLAEAEAAGAADPTGSAPNTHRGLPGMSGLVKPLAEGLEIRREVTVEQVLTQGAGFRLVAAHGQELGRFDRVISAIPVVQARRVLSGVLGGNGVGALESVVMDPCWTLMAGWTVDPKPNAPATAEPFAAILRQDRGRPVWVAHASPGWSRAHLEQEAERIRPVLLNALMAQLGTTTLPAIAMAHRWRFARTARPLGRPFLSEAGGRVLAGGDWALGPRAGHAWASGAAMAEALLA